MDLWDLTKLLLRRWYFALPMLLVSVATVFLAAQTVNPDYSAKGYLQLIPPPGSSQPEDPTAKLRPRNPWLDLGYEALGTAAVLKVTDKAALERLADAGLSDNATVLMSTTSPLFEIEAIGTSPAQATATVREIIRLLNGHVAASQKQYGVLREDTITTLTLDDGGNVEVVTAKVKRILIVAAGVGLLLTAAATIGLDALVRRVARRRLGFQDADLAPLPTPGGPPSRMPSPVPSPSNNPSLAGPRRAWRDSEFGAGPIPGPSPVLSLPAGPYQDRPRVSYDEPGPIISAPRSHPESDERPRPAPHLAYQKDGSGPGDAAAASEPRSDDASDHPPVPADATIVLPLAYLSRRDDRNSKN